MNGGYQTSLGSKLGHKKMMNFTRFCCLYMTFQQ